MFAIVLAFLLLSCAKPKKFEIGGKVKEVQPYGFLNPSDKNDSIQYAISVEDVILSAVFSETLVVPVVSLGYFMWKPVAKK